MIKNEQLAIYEKTKTTKWSESIPKRRLTWVGHLIRLNDKTPARVALREYLNEIPKPVGKHNVAVWNGYVLMMMVNIGLE